MRVVGISTTEMDKRVSALLDLRRVARRSRAPRAAQDGS